MMKSTPAAEVKIENVEESPGVLTSAIAAGGGVLKGIGSYVVSPTIEMVTGGSARDLQKTTPLASSVMMKEAMHHAAQDMATGKAKAVKSSSSTKKGHMIPTTKDFYGGTSCLCNRARTATEVATPPDSENQKNLSPFFPVDDPLVWEGLVGRIVSSNPNASAAQYVQYDFSGVTIRIAFEGERVLASMDGGGNYFNVFVDGGEHQLMLHKRTEACIKTVTDWFEPVSFYGFFVSSPTPGITPRLLPHPHNKTKRRYVEFIGDSDTTSYGNEGEITDAIAVHTMDPAKQNAWNSYAAQAARCFDADCSMVCWTGIGVHGAEPIPGTELDVMNGGMRTVYNRSVAYASSQPPADHPDLVVVYIGGNDLSGNAFGDLSEVDEALGGTALEGSPGMAGRKVLEDFSEALVEVLQAVRTRNLHAPVVLLAPNETTMSAESTTEEQAYTAGLVQRGVRLAHVAFSAWCVKNGHEPNSSFHILRPTPAISNPDVDPSEWGLLRHWSVKGHQKVARALVKVIEEALPEWKATSEPTPCPVLEPDTYEIGDSSALACSLM